MKTYRVTLVKPVMDYFRAEVEVQAESEEEAHVLALKIDEEKLDYAFWKFGDTSIAAAVVEVSTQDLPAKETEPERDSMGARLDGLADPEAAP